MRGVDELIAAAVERTGLDDFGGDTFREGLAVLRSSAAEDAALNDVGQAMFESQVAALLDNRLQLADWRARHPAVTRAPVAAPVFVLGLPRTGTTLLSYLLDRDPAHRSLLRWESGRSVPPPETATLRTDPRVAEVAAAQEVLDSLAPEFKAIHYEAPDGPTECVTLLGLDFRSLHFETVFNVPAYGAWHEACDMAPAYDQHRRALQVLQSRAPGRWYLKSPVHNLALDALVAVYPDARFVMTHRDPARVVASVCNLVRVLSGIGTDADHRPYIARRWQHVVEESLRRADDFRRRHGDTAFLDLSYDELVADPVAAVRRVYAHAGEDLSPAVEDSVRAYVAGNPQGRFGTHRYDPAELGLDAGALAERFAPYRDRYGVRAEPVGGGPGT